MSTKHAFNSPADQSAPEQPAIPSHPEITAIASPGVLIGTWVNVNPATRSIVKVVVGWAGGHLTIHAYGACSPTPCDWGSVNGLAYGDNVSSKIANSFSAIYAFAFKDTILTGLLQGILLEVTSFDHFKDGSGRSDYHTREYFRRG
jgi:hypothetical protein